jgi:hypothetical protein
MATEAQQIAQRVPGEKSSMPAIVLVLGWLIPGAGHVLLGKWIRGLLLFVSVIGMFLVGLGMQGKVYTPNTGEILDILGFAGQLGLGLLYVLARAFSWGASSVVNTFGDWGTKFIVVGGLLNLISAVDAHSLANGRKSS